MDFFKKFGFEIFIILLLLILLVVNILCFGILLANNNLKEIVGLSGTLGDTLGGIFSPFIGAISIYFIYKTFKAQREQLEDQKNANKATISSINFSNLLSEVEKTNDKIKSLKYSYYDNGTLHTYKGVAALQHFLNYRHGDFVVEYEEYKDGSILNNTLHVIEQFSLIYKNYLAVESELLPIHKDLFIDNFKNLITPLNVIDTLFIILSVSVKQHAQKINPESFTNPNIGWYEHQRNVYLLSIAYNEYRKNMEILLNGNLLESREMGQDYDVSLKGGFIDLDKIKSYDNGSGFVIKK